MVAVGAVEVGAVTLGPETGRCRRSGSTVPTLGGALMDGTAPPGGWMAARAPSHSTGGRAVGRFPGAVLSAPAKTSDSPAGTPSRLKPPLRARSMTAIAGPPP